LQVQFPNAQPGSTMSVPAQMNLVDTVNGDVVGNFSITSPTGTATGTTLIATPDSTGTITFSGEVMQRTSSTNPAFADFPVLLGGTFSTLQTPWYGEATLQYPVQQLPSANLFYPSQQMIPSFVPVPDILNTQAGPTSLLYPFTVASGCASGVSPELRLVKPDLSSTGAPAPAFIGVTGGTQATTLISPVVSNVGVVSSVAPAATGITLTQDPTTTNWLNASLSGTTTPATLFLSVNYLAAGNYSTTLELNAPGGLSLPLPVSYKVTPGPWFERFGFANSASYASDVVAPGEPFVIFGGDAFGPSTLAGPTLGTNGLVTTTAGNTQVLFDGVAAPLYYSVNASGIGQVAGFAPFELAGKTSTNVQVVSNGVTSPAVSIPVIDTVPGLYTANSSGSGPAAALNQDLSVNSSTNPAAVGSVIVLYGGGAGQTAPAGRDGGLAGVGAPLATLTLPVNVFIDGIQATSVAYAGPAPGLVEGVFQINATIPAGVRSGTNVPVVVQIEDKVTQPGVTIATK
jgi:uncharacterized protein (TIGR03437 family)